MEEGYIIESFQIFKRCQKKCGRGIAFSFNVRKYVLIVRAVHRNESTNPGRLWNHPGIVQVKTVQATVKYALAAG